MKTEKYKYMILSRLQMDCEYFLGFGNRNKKHLFFGNVNEQINEMKKLYNELEEKPRWLTLEQIEEYEKEMKKEFDS